MSIAKLSSVMLCALAQHEVNILIFHFITFFSALTQTKITTLYSQILFDI